MKGNSKLAIFGGEPVFRGPLEHYNSMAREELEAVGCVMKSGCLSAFYGSAGEEFFGGPMVREFEEAWRERFGVRHAVSVNSATSGLFAAMGAIGISPGDEVIVPPYTMSATVMAPLVYGGVPVFADIDPDTFCLDPEAVPKVITPRTKAIIAVNLFGHPARLEALRSIADQHHLRLIEDNAQGPLASEHGRLCGTMGDIGIFSLNYHKHIHTGEGGMCVTDQDDLSRRLQLIRNHGENLVEDWGVKDITNLVGFNYRMTELSAAVGIEQLRKIDFHVERREALGRRLSEGISGLEGLTPPAIRSGCRHVYYLWAIRFDKAVLGVTRDQFSRALAAEGFPHFNGYVRPLYLLPVFQRRTAFGSRGYPFALSQVPYPKGLCPVCERMHDEELICFETCMYNLSAQDADLFIEAIRKVHGCRDDLSSLGD